VQFSFEAKLVIIEGNLPRRLSMKRPRVEMRMDGVKVYIRYEEWKELKDDGPPVVQSSGDALALSV
jgi:hypothetical protein